VEQRGDDEQHRADEGSGCSDAGEMLRGAHPCILMP
jgi:hypothetical protein